MNKKCQVFTPENYVMELLDIVGYKHNLYGKKILENSCGDGNILVAVVQRYIDDCVMNGLSKILIRLIGKYLKKIICDGMKIYSFNILLGTHHTLHIEN